MNDTEFIDTISHTDIELNIVSINSSQPVSSDSLNHLDDKSFHKITATLTHSNSDTEHESSDNSYESNPVITIEDPKFVKEKKTLTQSYAKHRGTLCIRIGPMFSGKTTWLNGELTQLADKRFSVLKITHADDIRNDVEVCDNSGSTHNSSYKSLSSKITCTRVSNLKDVDVSKFHAIGIDESQFFPDLLEVVEDWVENKGKHIRVAGLDGDAFKLKFGQTLDLIPICDEVMKLTASCEYCLAELEQAGFHGNILSIAGPFTKRLGTSTEQKVVGGSDKYIPVCRFHHSI
jgi:thymidine kinase